MASSSVPLKSAEHKRNLKSSKYSCSSRPSFLVKLLGSERSSFSQYLSTKLTFRYLSLVFIFGGTITYFGLISCKDEQTVAG